MATMEMDCSDLPLGKNFPLGYKGTHLADRLQAMSTLRTLLSFGAPAKD